MTKFRSGKRKDGTRYSYPISQRGDAGQRQPSVEIVNVKAYGRFDQRDIDYAKDVLPDVDEDKDFGWLPALERDLEREFDEQDRNRLAKMFHDIKKGSDEQCAMALTELEKEYPTVYENYTGKVADIPRPKKNGERLTDKPIPTVVKETYKGAKEKVKAVKSGDPIFDFGRRKYREMKLASEAKKEEKKRKEALADAETKRLRKEAEKKWKEHEAKQRKKQEKKEMKMFEKAVGA